MFEDLLFPPSSWNFLSDKDDLSVFCSNQVTLGGLLDSSRMRSGQQKDQALIRSLKLSASLPREEKGAGDRVNHQWAMTINNKWHLHQNF